MLEKLKKQGRRFANFKFSYLLLPRVDQKAHAMARCALLAVFYFALLVPAPVITIARRHRGKRRQLFWTCVWNSIAASISKLAVAIALTCR